MVGEPLLVDKLDGSNRRPTLNELAAGAVKARRFDLPRGLREPHFNHRA